MATKIDLLKVLQERRGLTELSNRQPSALHLTPMRSHLWPVNVPKPKFTISIEWKTDPDVEYPVKILQVPPG